MLFPIGVPLEPSLYLQPFSRYLHSNIFGSWPWPFRVTWHLARCMRCEYCVPTACQRLCRTSTMRPSCQRCCTVSLCSATDIARLDAFVRRSKKLGYCRPETPAVAELFEKAVDDLFERINTNCHHVLYQFLPPKTAHSYNTTPQLLLNWTIYRLESSWFFHTHVI